MRLIRFSLTVALGLPLAVAAAEPPAATDGYSMLRAQLLDALQTCTSPEPASRCEPASQRLQELIAFNETAAAREQRPRCLGALSLLDSHLRVFRWRLEPLERLQAVIQQVEQACPPSVSAAPAAAN
jgi:hypothetical protein